MPIDSIEVYVHIDVEDSSVVIRRNVLDIVRAISECGKHTSIPAELVSWHNGLDKNLNSAFFNVAIGFVITLKSATKLSPLGISAAISEYRTRLTKVFVTEFPAYFYLSSPIVDEYKVYFGVVGIAKFVD